MALWPALDCAGIRIIGARHEQGAAYMALGAALAVAGAAAAVGLSAHQLLDLVAELHHHPAVDEAGHVGAVLYAALDLAWLTRYGAQAKLLQGAELSVPFDAYGQEITLDPHRSADYGGFWVMFPNVWAGLLRYDETGRIALDLESFRYFPDRAPEFDIQFGLREIIGVVADVRHGGLADAAVAEIRFHSECAAKNVENRIAIAAASIAFAVTAYFRATFKSQTINSGLPELTTFSRTGTRSLTLLTFFS